MNIFYLDEDISNCAKYHADSHVIKMILESAQILCTALAIHGIKTPYKPTHFKHPCVLWVAESLDNWMWLRELTLELDKEYRYRWNKNNSHKSALVVKSLIFSNIEYAESIGITQRPQAMPKEYRIPNDPIKAYRRYYATEKYHLHKYTKREKPYWLPDFRHKIGKKPKYEHSKRSLYSRREYDTDRL